METTEPQDLYAHPGQDFAADSLRELIGHYWSLFKRYYWILIVAVVVVVTGTYFWTKQQPKIYQATSKLMFQTSQRNIFGRQIEQVELLDTGGPWHFEQFWNTQKEVLQSRWFAERVIKREGLLGREGFLPPPPEGKERTPEERLKVAIDKVQSVAKISLQPESRVALIEVKTKDPELSATIANGIADAYVEYTKEYQSGGLKQIVNWFDNYVSTKRQELSQAQTKLQQFMRDKNILSLSYEDRQSLTADSMQKVNDELLAVRSRLYEKEALLHQLEELEQTGKGLRVIAELTESESLKSSLEREAELEQKLAALQTRYLDAHPDVQAVHEELTSVRKHIDEEISRIRSAVENRVAVLRRNEANLESELADLKAEISQLNQMGVEYNQLKDNADNLKKLYETVLSRSSELDINALYDNNVVQVLEEAAVPEEPVSPNLPINLAIGFALGLGLGLGTMVLLDSLDNTVKSGDDISRVTDRPILATLPHLNASVLKGLEQIGESPADTITHTAPKSSFAEGIKTLRANLMFMSPDDPDKMLLVTSPGPSEGKTITSVNMAIAMAQSGLKTVIIDSDMRRPRIHKALGLENDIGLSNAIMSEAELDSAVLPTGVENLDALTCGTVPPNPSELLHAQRFHDLIDQLRERYDRVIFDSPPLGAVADALILSQTVDTVLLVMKFGKTRREMLQRAVEQLEGVGAPFKGCVLNEVDNSAGGYGYSYYYYRYSYEEQPSRKGSRLAS